MSYTKELSCVFADVFRLDPAVSFMRRTSLQVA